MELINMEEWCDINGFDRYMISSEERVKTKDYTQNACHCRPNGAMIKGKILKTPVDTNGYQIVRLYSNGKSYKKYIHRLVAESFIKKQDEMNWVNHIDSNKMNNKATNLEWCTPNDNVQHCIKKGRAVYMKGSELPYSLLDEEKVREIKTLLHTGMMQKEIAHKFGVSTSCIHSINVGRTWKDVN